MPTSDELKQELKVLLQSCKDKRLEIKEQLKMEKQKRKKCYTCDTCHGSGRMYLTDGCYCDCDRCDTAGTGWPSNIREGY